MIDEPRIPSDFTTFRRRVTLRGSLTIDTALRIATGRSDDVSDADMAVFKDALRRPFIPGSSFKGALRAQVERLARAAWGGDSEHDAACDPLDEDKRCVTKKTMDELRKKYGRDSAGLARQILKRSCRVCRVFGSPWLASKLMVKDLLLAQPEMWAERRYEVRAGVGIDRDADAAKERILYNSQVVSPGTAFRWEMIIENADPEAEEPLVFLGLREMIHGYVPMGGGKSRGLGRVQVTVDDSEVVDEGREALLAYLKSGKGVSIAWADLEKRIGGCVQKLVEGK